MVKLSTEADQSYGDHSRVCDHMTPELNALGRSVLKLLQPYVDFLPPKNLPEDVLLLTTLFWDSRHPEAIGLLKVQAMGEERVRLLTCLLT